VQRPSTFGESVETIMPLPMALSAGTKLGPYEIVAPLGAGGMGEVYRARDSRLGRDVALKILPPQVTADADRVARFQREARLLASLNHSHIGAIYGVEDAGNTPALVLELVEGDTLEDRVRRGRLPVSESLTIAQQIADALDAAHSAGVIHRDLKPANIKITSAGVVKVLDFGLGKAITTEEPGSDLPTMTSGGTIAGAVMGTAAYMSPEQARGHPVDKRTDIWAFGCVLFEMLTGSSAFGRPTATDTVAAVVTAEPGWKLLPAETPASVRRLLARCLQKDAKRRLHDVADARIELEETIDAPREQLPTRSTPAWLAWASFAASLGIVAALALLWMVRGTFGKPRAERSPTDARVIRLTNLPGLEESPAISPDGKSVVFTAGVGDKRQIFVQLIAGGAPLQVTHDPVYHQCPRWSADSSSIFYFSPAVLGTVQGSILEVSALGGVSRRVINSVGCADVQMDGRLVLFRLAKEGIQLGTSPPDASKFDVICQFAPSTYYLYPRWSPDGKWIAFQRGDSIRFDIFVTAASEGQPRQLTHDNDMMAGFGWLPDSTGIVYSSSRGGTMPYLPALGLWQVTLQDGSVRGLTSGETSYASPDISKNGSIFVSRMKLDADIWKFPVDGSPKENVRRGVRVTRQTGQVLTPTASPDDQEVAFLSDSAGHANLWIVNAQSGAMRQITYERDPNTAVGVPIWSPKGNTITFVSSRGNQGLTFGVWLVDSDASNLRNIANPGVGPAWSQDGRWVYYSTWSGAAGGEVDLKKVPMDGGSAVTVRTERLRNVIGLQGSTLYYAVEKSLVDGTPEFEIRAATPEDAPFRVIASIPGARIPIWQICNPSLSPDGKWMAQALTDGFTTNIWALSTTTGEWRQITDFGERATFIARRVSWSADGHSILAAVAEGDADIDLLEGLASLEHR